MKKSSFAEISLHCCCLQVSTFTPVILSVVRAQARTKSKDPEKAGRNQGATGSFLETSFVTGAFVSWESGENPWIGMAEDAFSGFFTHPHHSRRSDTVRMAWF
jgi:hypothetical protein